MVWAILLLIVYTNHFVSASATRLNLTTWQRPSDSDRTVSSTGDWERTLPGHLYPYHLHDNLSVKFVFDDNDDGEEVERVAVRFLDGSEEEIVVLWWYKDKVDVKVYDQELQPLDCSDIRAVCSDELGLLSSDLVWTFNFELRYTISISVTRTTDGKEWQKTKELSELLRRRLTQISFEFLEDAHLEVRYKSEPIDPPDGYTRLRPTRDDNINIPFSPSSQIFILQQRLVPRFSSSNTWNRIVFGNQPQLICYWRFSDDYPTEVHVIASWKTSTEKNLFDKTWRFTAEDGDEYNRIVWVFDISSDRTNITIGSESGDIPTEKFGMEPTEVQIRIKDFYHDAMYTIQDKVFPPVLGHILRSWSLRHLTANPFPSSQIVMKSLNFLKLIARLKKSTE